MEHFIDLLKEDIEILSSDDPKPDVIIVCIPEEVMEVCTPEDEEYANVSADGSDLRNRIKILGMENDIPN
jgi:hypothetical protein